MTPPNSNDDKPVNHSKSHVRVSVVEKDGQITSVSDRDAMRDYLAHRTRAAEAAARRRALWGDGGRDAMAALCRLFPSLRHVAGADPWDPTEILRFACEGHSHGEILAATFVLHVWNSTADWNDEAHRENFLTGDERLRPFDLFEAWSTWDENHRQAALTWLKDPFWP